VSGTTHPTAQSHVPEDMNPQQYCCENVKCHNVLISVERGGLFSIMLIILSVYISTGINQSSPNFSS